MAKAGTIEIQNFTSPGSTYRVDAAKYEAMRSAFVAALPAGEPGLTVAQLKAALLTHLSEELFPGGAKAGWWLKAVQLDLEAKGLVRRTATSPLRLYRT